MSDPMIQIDPGLLAEFIDESSEALSSLDHLFIDLEKAPSDLAIVGAIFRPVHSIKGNSAFFGLNKIKTLAHESETLLDMVRNGALAVTPDLISVLLSATDELKAMFDRVRDAQPQIIEEAVYDSLIQRIKSTASQDNEHTIWRSIFEKLQKLTDEMGSQAKELAEPLLVLVDELKRVCPKSDDHAAAPTSDAEPSPLQAIRQIIHEPFEEYLPDDKAALIPPALVQLQEIADGDQTLQLIDDTLETYNTFFSTVGIDTLAADLLNDKLDLLASDGKWRQTSTPAEKDSKSKSAPSPPAPTAPKPAPHTEASKTMRVPEAHIDTFLEYVGELLVVGDMFSYLEKRLASGESGTDIVSNFRQANQTFATLSNNLQVSIMSIRKVTVSMLLQKVPRLVRDIATASGKQIDVQIAGEQTEIDKSLVDMLDAP